LPTLAGLLILALSLTSCAARDASSPCPAPALPEWSRGDTSRLADEVERLDQGSPLFRAVREYYSIRRQIQACEER
jgi:hypothetical protein